MSESKWPVADFDPVRRLRVLAATIPGAAIHQRVINAPFTSVWAVASDLEDELPRWLFPDIRTVRLASTGPGHAVAHVRGHSGLRARFDVVLQPGWCLMQSRFLIGGMAAVPASGGTQFAVLGAFRGPLRALTLPTRPFKGPIGRGALNRFTQRVDAYDTANRST